MSAQKRRKLDSDVNSCLLDVIGEVDLEIALRKRLETVLESRIAWARVLQGSVGQAPVSIASPSFKEAAFDALSAVEAPVAILFSRELPAPSNQSTPKPTRPAPKPKTFTSRHSKPTFLFIRSAHLDWAREENAAPNQAYLLRCPVCLRTSFTSLQGLLNHARLTHALEWGNHDACVRACAVVDGSLNLDEGVEVGVTTGGILPGIQSLFEIGLGAHHTNIIAPQGGIEYVKVQDNREPISHLARTLGLHGDTPSLAPFLGKRAKRREIRVWDEDSFVDTHQPIKLTPETGKSTSGRSWRMPFSYHNAFEETPLDPAEGVKIAKKLTSPENAATNIASLNPQSAQETVYDAAPQNGITLLATRFHFASRIIIADHSLWIPPERRLIDHEDHTHQWMISVDSPSYSQHITTILRRLSVIPLSGADNVATSVPGAMDPPFVITGTSKQPFLAKIELQFNEISAAKNPDTSDPSPECQTVFLEHWVELDLFQSPNPVLGDEQVRDIELDKRTLIKPGRTNHLSIKSKVLWNNSGFAPEVVANFTPKQTYHDILSKLVKRFPMTLQDSKGHRAPNPPLPYRVVASVEHFMCLIVGRRKAIEWGRARAIKHAYDLIPQKQDNRASLTTAMVHTWLISEGHFPYAKLRQPPEGELETNGGKVPRPEDCIKSSTLWCQVCGIKGHSPAFKNPSLKNFEIDEGRDAVCQTVATELRVTRLPPINFGSLFPRSAITAPFPRNQSGNPSMELDTRALLTCSDPHLTLSIRSAVAELNLSTFESLRVTPTPSPSLPLHESAKPCDEFETSLAPHALLALLSQQLIRTLVEAGLEVCKRDRILTHSGSALNLKLTNSEKDQPAEIALLTPVHILSGILTRGQGRGRKQTEIDKHILYCLSRVGIAFDSKMTFNDKLAQNQEELCYTQHIKMEN